jgi:hypothetical protein
MAGQGTKALCRGQAWASFCMLSCFENRVRESELRDCLLQATTSPQDHLPILAKDG